jgi:hypothetical protein
VAAEAVDEAKQPIAKATEQAPASNFSLLVKRIPKALPFMVAPRDLPQNSPKALHAIRTHPQPLVEITE